MARRLLYHKRKNSEFIKHERASSGRYSYQVAALSLCAIFVFFYVSGLFILTGHTPNVPASPRLWRSIPISRIYPIAASHLYREDGLLEVNYNGTHPIPELIDRAEDIWIAKHARASTTFDEAVMEYERRYNRLPPVGFDDWWNYAMENNVQLPDEYDSIYNDLEPLWGISPEDLQKIQAEWFEQEYRFAVIIGKENGQPLRILNNSMVEHKMEAHLDSIMERIRFLEPVDDLLPDFKAVITPMDSPTSAADWEHKQMLLDAAKKGVYVDMKELLKLSPPSEGWEATCSPDSPARKSSLDPSKPYTKSSTNKSKTFIYDHRKSMDPCLHPTHFLQSGQFLNYKQSAPLKRVPTPQFSSCSTSIHFDLSPVPPGSITEDREPLPWAEKRDERLLWRGRNTGILSGPATYWKQTQRPRLVHMASEVDGFVDILRSPEPSNEYKPVEEPRRWSVDLINSALVDIKFAGKPIQCEEVTCKEMEDMFEWSPFMSESEASGYKYVVDVDGNGWSSRFRRLMNSNSVVFKSTIYPEWFTDRVQPWVHYVPISIDYSDLYDAFIFFRGDVGGRGNHDVLARRIAEAAHHWTQTYARREDMTAYMFRLFLEYARVSSSDRQAMTMTRRKPRHARFDRH